MTRILAIVYAERQLVHLGWYVLQGNGPVVGAERAITLLWDRDQDVPLEVLGCGLCAPNAQDQPVQGHIWTSSPPYFSISGRMLQIPGALLFLRRLMAVTTSSNVVSG